MHRITLIALTLLVAGSGWAAELVTSPNSPSAWTLNVDSNAAATLREDQGALRLDVTRIVPTQPWCVQLYQAGKHARDGSRYTIRFQAKATADRDLAVQCQLEQQPWDSVIGKPLIVQVGPAWRSFDLPITIQGAGSNSLQVPQIQFGHATGTVWVKNVSVSDVAGTPEPDQKHGPAATETSASLLKDPTNISNWRFECQPDAHANFVSEAGVLRIEVQQAGSEAFHVQIFQVPAQLPPGAYVCSLIAKASAARKVSFTVEHNQSPYEKIIPVTQFPIGTDWKEYRIRFRVSKPYPGETRVPVLQVGDSAGSVFIRSISLTRQAEDK